MSGRRIGRAARSLFASSRPRTGGESPPRPESEQQYTDAWSRVEEVVDRILDSGEVELSRALRRVEAEVRGLDGSPADGTAYAKAVRLPKSALYAARQGYRMRTLIDLCRPDTALVVELGCGWGPNLLDLHLAGGPLVPYHGLELTEPGRRIAEKLARLEPRLELLTAPFDLRDAHYDLPRVDGHALVFTSHSIEQIPQLPEETLTRLFELAPSLTVAHFEPIGWQVRPGAEVGATQEYAVRNDYNRNLWSLLQGLERAGTIVIDTVEPDVIQHKLHNVSTLVVWHRNQAAAGNATSASASSSR